MIKKSQIKKGFQFGSLFSFIAFLMISCSSDPGNTQRTQLHIGAALHAAGDTIPVKDTTGVVHEDTIKVSAEPPTYTIIGVGDMMLGTNYPSTSYLPPNGGSTMLAYVKEELAAADVTFGNLEGTILDKGGKAKRCKNPDACYVFRSPESYTRHFVDAGFDFLSIANNHSGDFGQEGRTATKRVLKEAGIAFAGLAGTDEYAIIERDGMTYGMCAFAPNWGTCSIHHLDKARQIVKKLEAECDVVIVSFHGGAEGAKHQHVPKRKETYYGENRGDVHQFAHTVIDAGADIVFGHGPHVTRAMELYKDRLICYSLGNFCTYGRFNLRGAAGIAPLVTVEVDTAGAFVSGKVTPVFQSYNHGPKPDPQKRAIKKLIELTNADFPNTPLLIGEDGVLSKK